MAISKVFFSYWRFKSMWTIVFKTPVNWRLCTYPCRSVVRLFFEIWWELALASTVCSISLSMLGCSSWLRRTSTMSQLTVDQLYTLPQRTTVELSAVFSWRIIFIRIYLMQIKTLVWKKSMHRDRLLSINSLFSTSCRCSTWSHRCGAPFILRIGHRGIDDQCQVKEHSACLTLFADVCSISCCSRGMNCLHVLAANSKENAQLILTSLLDAHSQFPLDIQDGQGNTGR